MKTLSAIVLFSSLLWGQSSITWTYYPAPSPLSSCSDIATPPCYWPRLQGYTTIKQDDVHGGAFIYADRQRSEGTVTVTGGTNVAWASGDKFGLFWGAAAGDKIYINGTIYTIMQGSATATSLTLTSTAPNGTFSYYAGGDGTGGNGNLVSATDAYTYSTSTHKFTLLGGTSTLSQASSATEVDDPTLAYPADRQFETHMAYDSSRGAIWLTGGVSSTHFWNCMTQTGAVCATGRNSVTWRMDLASKTWTALQSPHHPLDQWGAQGVAVDTDDQIVLQAGYAGDIGFRTAIYCPTDKNPTPGTLTANQITAGCIQTSGADDWCAFHTTGLGCTSLPAGLDMTTQPYLIQTQIYYDHGTGKFFLFMGEGSTGPNYVINPHVYSYAPLTKTWAQADTGTGCPMPAPATVTFAPWIPGVAQLSNGKFLYHYFPLSVGGTTSDWIFDPSAGSCTQITTNGGGPVTTSGGAYEYGTNLAQDSVTGTIVAWAQASTDHGVWEGSFPPAAPVISTSSLPSGNQYTAYSTTLAASNSPTSWAVTGALPTGMSFNTSTGVLSGTPTQGGSWSLSFTATNGGGTSSPAVLTLSLTVTPGLGASTYNCVDADGDGYGVGAGCLGPDADDTDATVHSYSDAINKWSTLPAFWSHLGYTPTTVWYVDPSATGGTCASVSTPFAYDVTKICTPTEAYTNMAYGDSVVYRGGSYAPNAANLYFKSGVLNQTTITITSYTSGNATMSVNTTTGLSTGMYMTTGVSSNLPMGATISSINTPNLQITMSAAPTGSGTNVAAAFSTGTCASTSYFLAYPGEQPQLHFNASQPTLTGTYQSCFVVDGLGFFQDTGANIGTGKVLGSSYDICMFHWNVQHIESAYFTDGLYPQSCIVAPQVLHNYIHDSRSAGGDGHGIYMGSRTAAAGGGTIRGNIFARNEETCLHLNGYLSGTTVDSNMLYGCNKGMQISGVQNAIIENNTIETEATKAIELYAYGTVAYPPGYPGQCLNISGNTFRNNTIFQNSQSFDLTVITSGTVQAGSPAINIEDDASCLGHGYPQPLINNNTWANNLLIHNCGTNCTPGGYQGVVVAYSSAKYSDQAQTTLESPPWWQQWLQSDTWANNIVQNVDQSTHILSYSVWTYGTGQGSLTFNPCSWFTNTANVPQYLGTSANCNADPLFVAANPQWTTTPQSWNLSVRSGSPALAGGYAADTPTYDAIGFPRSVTTPSIGAYESAGTSPIPASVSASGTTGASGVVR